MGRRSRSDARLALQLRRRRERRGRSEGSAGGLRVAERLPRVRTSRGSAVEGRGVSVERSADRRRVLSVGLGARARLGVGAAYFRRRRSRGRLPSLSVARPLLSGRRSRTEAQRNAATVCRASPCWAALSLRGCQGRSSWRVGGGSFQSKQIAARLFASFRGRRCAHAKRPPSWEACTALAMPICVSACLSPRPVLYALSRRPCVYSSCP